MIMKYIKSILVIALLAFCVSCEKDMSVTPSRIYTIDATDIIGTNALVGGNVIANGDLEIRKCGICWNTKGMPTVRDSHIEGSLSENHFYVTLSGLTVNTTYYVRAYVVDKNGTYYGDEKTFTTTDELYPDLRTKDVSAITKTSAVGGGVVVFAGNPEVTERGICWATTQNPSVENSKKSNGAGKGDYLCDITGLTKNTTYYVRAYAYCANTGKYFYGPEKTFRTKAN
jgi:hypothetical protein